MQMVDIKGEKLECFGHQEVSQAKVEDAFVVIFVNQRGHRDDEFRVVVFDGGEIAELALFCIGVGDDVRSLDVDALRGIF